MSRQVKLYARTGLCCQHIARHSFHYQQRSTSEKEFLVLDSCRWSAEQKTFRGPSVLPGLSCRRQESILQKTLAVRMAYGL